MRTTGLCSARLHFSSCAFFANNFVHSIFAMLAIGSSPVITVYLARVKRKNADNRTLPFPANGSPSARFRKRNVTDVGKPTRTRPEARTKTKGEAKPLLLFWCGRQDLNLHDCSMDPKSIASAISPRPHFLAATFLSYNFTVLSTYRRLFIV